MDRNCTVQDSKQMVAVQNIRSDQCPTTFDQGFDCNAPRFFCKDFAKAMDFVFDTGIGHHDSSNDTEDASQDSSNGCQHRRHGALLGMLVLSMLFLFLF